MKQRPGAGDALLRLLRGQRELTPDSRWLVGVSGGADSTALLLLLHRLSAAMPLRLAVVHLNHGLRGREADADARFVAALARRLGIPCVVGEEDVSGLAARRRWSIEQAAREARMAFFARQARRFKARGVLLAHTRDDQAETLLLRLLRGAGSQGLAGMRGKTRVRGLVILRPLLSAAREDLRLFLRETGERWREDGSNQDERFLRNAIRHRVLPELEAAAGRSLVASIARTAGLLADEEAVWDALLRPARKRCAAPGNSIRSSPLRRLPVAVQRRLLVDWLWRITGGGDFAEVERVRALAAGPSRRADIGRGWIAEQQEGCLRLRRDEPAGALPVIALPHSGSITSAEWGIRVTVRPASARLRDTARRVGALPAGVCLNLARASAARLALRAWQPGDRMKPARGNGTKKLQDIFSDAKVPRDERSRIPILTADGNPIWIPGYRPAEGWAAAGAEAKALQVRIRPLA